jgi:hypothetical protein
MQRACTGTLLQLATCVNDANCAVRRKFNLAAAEGGRPKGRRRRPEMPPKSAARQGGASAFVVYSMPGRRRAAQPGCPAAARSGRGLCASGACRSIQIG